MSLAAETRAAVRSRPFLFEALRAGVVNYAAAARVIDVADDTEAVSTALRRFAERLPQRETEERRARVTMHGGLERGEDDPLLSVGGVGYVEGEGSLTGVLATGDVDVTALSTVLGVLHAHEIEPVAAGSTAEALLVVVARRDAPETVERLEGALSTVPAKATV